MGQKTHPFSFRLGYNRTWSARWFSEKGDYADLLHEDLRIRRYLRKNLAHAGISEIVIERSGKRVRIEISSSRPGIVIGRKGQDIDRLRDELQEMTGREIYIDIKEVKNINLDAQLVAENIAYQLEKRIFFRRAMKKAIENVMRSGAEGVKVMCAGRLGGAEIARQEGYREGRMPLHTIRADVDYGFTEARTTYGAIGVKVWIYKGEKAPGELISSPEE